MNKKSKLWLSLLCVLMLAACGPRPTPAVTPTRRPQEPTPAPPTATPYHTYTPYPTYTPVPTATPVPSATPTAAPTSSPTATATPTPEPVAPADGSGGPSVAQPPAQASAAASTLTRRPDHDPAPPFSVTVSRAMARDDGVHYEIVGTIRNDGDRAYAATGVIATFYDAQNRRGGGFEVRCSARLLEPGASCPFSLVANGKDLVAYVLHPFGRPVEHRNAVGLDVSQLRVSSDGMGNVLVTGFVINNSVFSVREVTVVGELLDAGGAIVSVGEISVRGELAAGAQATFDLRIPHRTYTAYSVTAHGIQQ